MASINGQRNGHGLVPLDFDPVTLLKEGEVPVTWDEAADLAERVVLQVLKSGVRYDVILIPKHGASFFGALIERVLAEAEAKYARLKREEIGLSVVDSPPPRIVYFPDGESFKDKNVLPIDEVWETGKSIVRLIHEVQKSDPALIDIAVLHYKPECNIYLAAHREPRFFGQKVDRAYRCYPWERWERKIALEMSKEAAAPAM